MSVSPVSYVQSEHIRWRELDVAMIGVSMSPLSAATVVSSYPTRAARLLSFAIVTECELNVRVVWSNVAATDKAPMLAESGFW